MYQPQQLLLVPPNACLGAIWLLLGFFVQPHVTFSCPLSTSTSSAICIANGWNAYPFIQSSYSPYCYCPFDPGTAPFSSAKFDGYQYYVTCPLCFSDSRLYEDYNALQDCQWPPYLQYHPYSAAASKLNEMYDSLNGDLWLRNDNWKSSLSVCSWYGITCRESSDGTGSHVAIVGIQLSGNNLQGVIPHDLGLSFPFLQVLDMSFNKITGFIPVELTCMPSLVKLILNDNRLQGSIPDFSSCQFLEEINLRSNLLSGTLSLSNLPSTLNQNPTKIIVSRNFIQSIVPGLWAFLPNSLRYLDFADNLVYGNIPSILLKSSSLSFLYGQNNLLVGPIPSLDEQNNFKQIDFSGNPLSGELPASFAYLWGDEQVSADVSIPTAPVDLLLDLSGSCISGNVSDALSRIQQKVHFANCSLENERLRSKYNIQTLIQMTNCQTNVICLEYESNTSGASSLANFSLCSNSSNYTNCSQTAPALNSTGKCKQFVNVSLTGATSYVCESYAAFENVARIWGWWSGRVNLQGTMITLDDCHKLETRQSKGLSVYCPEQDYGQGPVYEQSVPLKQGFSRSIALKTGYGNCSWINLSPLSPSIAGSIVSCAWKEVNVEPPLTLIPRYILAIPIHRVCPDSSFCNPLTIHWRCFKGNAKPGRDYLPSSGQISWPANVQGIRYAFVSVRLTGRLPYPVYFSLVIAPSVGSACGSACSFASECDASLVCKDTWTLAEYSQFDVEPSRCLNSCTCSLPTGNLTKPASCSGVEPLSNQNILIPSSKALTTVRISRCYKSSPAAGACLPDELHPCGDGYRHVNEECDDGNTVDGDGCSAQCAVEDFYSCVGGTSTSQDRCSFNSPGLLSPIEWLNTQGALRAGQLYQNIQWADEMFWNYNVYGQPVAQAIGCLVDPNSPFTLNMPASPFISTSPANCARIASLLGYAGFCRQYAGQCYTQRDFIFTVSSLKPSNTCVGNSGGEGSMYCYYVSYHTSSLYFVQQHDPCQIPGYCSPIGICDSNLASVPIQVSCTCNQSLSFGNGEFCSIHETQNLNCHGASSIWSSGICFFLASESIQYGSASSVCAAEGANVASILSATQNSAASSLLPFGQSAWIGYVKEGAAFDWTQSSLTPQIQVLSSTYTAWAGGEPIHNGSCTVLHATGEWVVQECNETSRTLCAFQFLNAERCGMGSTCDKNALCRDQINGYTCECKSGFSGSGNAGAPEEVTGSRNQGVFFNGSLPATAIQYARLGYAAADPDAWLDRPHAILQDGESVFVQVDLGRIFPIGNIKLYMYWPQERAYSNLSFEISSTGEFNLEQITLFSCNLWKDCGIETSSGRTVQGYNLAARYVRVYSGRSNLDNTVRFLRLSVFTNVGVACAACPLGTIGKAGEPNTCLRCNRTEAAANCSRQDNASQTETSTCLPIASCWQGQGKMYNGTCFRVFENSSGVTWKEANESCWRHGGELGMVKVAHDQDLINSLILTPAWLGWSGELRYTSDTSWELLNSSWVDGQSASSVRLSGVCDFLECSGSFSTAQVCGMTARGGMFPSLCDASLNAYVCFKVVPSETCSVR